VIPTLQTPLSPSLRTLVVIDLCPSSCHCVTFNSAAFQFCFFPFVIGRTQPTASKTKNSRLLQCFVTIVDLPLLTGRRVAFAFIHFIPFTVPTESYPLGCRLGCPLCFLPFESLHVSWTWIFEFGSFGLNWRSWSCFSGSSTLAQKSTTGR